MVSAGFGAEVGASIGEVGAGHVDGEIACFFDELIGETAWPNEDGPGRFAPGDANGPPADSHGVGGLIGFTSGEQEASGSEDFVYLGEIVVVGDWLFGHFENSLWIESETKAW